MGLEAISARWEGINGGPFIDANELLEALRRGGPMNTASLSNWIAAAKAKRLDEVAAAFTSSDAPELQKDLLALRDELAGEER